MSTVSRRLFQWHRWLAWLVGIQLVIWVTSGIVFAWLPFEPWVKAGDQLQRPVLALTHLPPGLDDLPADKVRSLSAVTTPRGAAWRVQLAGQPKAQYRLVDGTPWAAPDAELVRSFARTLVRGQAPITGVTRLAEVPRRLLIVDETGGRGDVWRVDFDDALGTRVYLDGEGGDLVAIRNEAWVAYDFLWRLHIMDYRGGEDFNNKLLRLASAAAWLMAAAGAVLAVFALRRTFRRKRA